MTFRADPMKQVYETAFLHTALQLCIFGAGRRKSGDRIDESEESRSGSLWPGKIIKRDSFDAMSAGNSAEIVISLR